jgi:peptide/nickel transport system substrate-binding protein
MKEAIMKKCSGLIFVITALILNSFTGIAYAEKALNIGVIAADGGIMDPYYASASNEVPIVTSIFSGLVRFAPGTVDLAQLEPDLAERWTVSSDGKQITFHLRKGVQFHHDFGELTSEDVVFSLQKASNKESSKWSNDYDVISKVEALDKYTVQVTFKQNVPAPLLYFSNYHGGLVVSKKAYEKYGSTFKLNPVGTGPFAFQEYVPRQYTALKAHKDYFKGKPKIDKVVYHFIESDQAREMGIVKGELDMVEGLSAEWWANKLASDKNLKVDLFAPGDLTTIHFNMSWKPLDNLKVRQAIVHAMNKVEWRQLSGLAITADAVSPVPEGYLGYTGDVKKYEFNLDKARNLLKEAGYPNGFDLGEIIASKIYLPHAELLQSQLKSINIALKIKMVDHPTFHQLIRANQSPIVPYACGRVPVADSFLSQFYHSKAIVGKPTAVTNFSHYGEVTPGVDDLIDKAKDSPDTAKKIEYWVMAQKKIMEDLPAYSVRTVYTVYVRKNNVKLGYDLKYNIFYNYQITEDTDIST